MAGGNIAAAHQRFSLARDELSAQAAKSGYTPALSCQLGEVCGSQVCTTAQLNVICGAQHCTA